MLLSLHNISKGYGSEAEGTYRKVLDGLSLSLNQGESIAILGPSGSGKTTLLSILGTLDFPDSGNIYFKAPSATAEILESSFTEKDNILSYSQKELEHFRNRQIGFVFQFHHLLPQCTLLENILLPTLTIKDKTKREATLARARVLMARVGILQYRNQFPNQLSGGECQRAALVRALINNPGLLLADEPTGALDEDNVNRLADLLLEINKQDGVSLIVVTHSISLAARMDKVYELKNGSLHLKNSAQ
ncbi:MAG: ABC transporter ATP-binding protein [Bacteroidetes bacterium]|nr:ABC transporter ATP-binding protein [Bacteroidota bacterium]